MCVALVVSGSWKTYISSQFNNMLVELPEEILLIILKKLDLHSKFSLYNVCLYLRHLVTFHGDNKTFDLSKSTLATVETIKQSFFKNVSTQIEDLNLCTVPNITKSVLLPVFKKMQHLKCLNVSFTSVVIPDLIEILKVAPSLKKISINFEFGNVNPCKLSPKMLNECRNLFKQLTDVEFVGSPSNLLYSQLPHYVLENTNLDTLKFSVVKCQHATYQNANVETDIKFKHLALFFTHWKEVNIYYGKLSEIPILAMSLLSGKYEFVFIKWIKLRSCKVYASTAFEGLFQQNFQVEEECLYKLDQEVNNGNIAIFMWNKQYNTFDSKFFFNFFLRVKCFFPQFVNSTKALVRSPLKCNWFYLTDSSASLSVSNQVVKDSETTLKRKRIAPQTYTLEYDNCFSQMDEIEITLNLQMPWNPISLSSSSNYLKKITYLSLVEPFVHFSADFFKVLFNSCDKLCTLNVEASAISKGSTHLSRYILLSKSLRNLRLVDKRIDHKSLFLNLSQSVLLENIHIIDEVSEVVNIGDISCIIANCPNMYSLFVQVAMSNSSKLKALRLLNKAKSLHNRSFLKIELHTGCGYKGLSYDPLMEVFKINPIKPV